MKYPRMNNVLTFSEKEDGSFLAKNNLNDKRWIISKECKMFLEQLDGRTNPYMILRSVPKNEVRRILEQYEKRGLLFKYRLRILNIFSYMYAVLIPNFTERDKRRAQFLKDVLIYSWLPVLIWGIWLSMDIWMDPHAINVHGYDYLTGFIGGTLLGVVFHEAAHGIVGLATGAKVLEFGVMIQYFLPGAYVLMNTEDVKRMDRAKIMAAGIEMNIWLGGVFLGLSALFPGHFYMFVVAAVANLILAAFNVTFVEGFDGMQLISELIGIDDFVARAKEVTRSKKKRRKIRKYKGNGEAFITACYLIRLFQVVLPIAIVLTIVNMWGGFFR